MTVIQLSTRFAFSGSRCLSSQTFQPAAMKKVRNCMLLLIAFRKSCIANTDEPDEQKLGTINDPEYNMMSCTIGCPKKYSCLTKHQTISFCLIVSIFSDPEYHL